MIDSSKFTLGSLYAQQGINGVSSPKTGVAGSSKVGGQGQQSGGFDWRNLDKFDGGANRVPFLGVTNPGYVPSQTHIEKTEGLSSAGKVTNWASVPSDLAQVDKAKNEYALYSQALGYEADDPNSRFKSATIGQNFIGDI